ncbi:hypothetical protein CTAM01_09109, partial [Colletotrichum tamarilloi]
LPYLCLSIIRLPSDLIKTLSGKTPSKPSSWKPIHPRGQAPESNCRPVNGARLASVLPALIIDGWGFLLIQASNSTTQSILGPSTPPTTSWALPMACYSGGQISTKPRWGAKRLVLSRAPETQVRFAGKASPSAAIPPFHHADGCDASSRT